MVSRTDRGIISNWWWTIDRTIFTCAIILLATGIILSFAASPSVAHKLGLSDFHFVVRQIFYAMLSFLVMILISLFSVRNLRLFCFVVIFISFILVIVTLFRGSEIKGAHRWISVFGISVQPSEFLKPAFIIINAWILSEKNRPKIMFPYLLSIAIYLIVSCTLVLQPDFGQMLLLTICWGILLFLSGISLLWIPILMVSTVFFFGASYVLVPHVRDRVHSFITGTGNTFQVDMGRDAILHGGWFGVGPGEGIIKKMIPDSHTDFIFSVAAEEYGILFCIFMVLIFFIMIVRSFYLALDETNSEIRLSIVGISVLFGFQALTNISVNLHLIPPKGMTLPFVSYGGSSLLATSLTIGILLSLSRYRPEKRVSLNKKSSEYD